MHGLIDIDLGDDPSIPRPPKQNVHLSDLPDTSLDKDRTSGRVRACVRFSNRAEIDVHELSALEIAFQNIVSLARAVVSAFSTAKVHVHLRGHLAGKRADPSRGEPLLNSGEDPPALLLCLRIPPLRACAAESVPLKSGILGIPNPPLPLRRRSWPTLPNLRLLPTRFLIGTRYPGSTPLPSWYPTLLRRNQSKWEQQERNKHYGDKSEHHSKLRPN